MTKKILTIFAAFLIPHVSGATFVESGNSFSIEGETEINVDLRSLKITGTEILFAELTASSISTEVDHSDYRKQFAGGSLNPTLYTTYPGNSSVRSEILTNVAEHSIYIFPLTGSNPPELNSTASELHGESHSEDEFVQEFHQFQHRTPPAIDVSKTTQMNIATKSATITGDFLLILWEASANLDLDQKNITTGFFVENQTYLPNGEILVEDKFRRIAYFTVEDARLEIQGHEFDLDLFAESFSAKSSTPPSFEDGRMIPGVNGTQEYVLQGTQVDDQIQLVLETPTIEETPEEEPQVTVSKAVLPKWMTILAISLPLPMAILLTGVAVIASTKSVESRARRGQYVTMTPWLKFFPRSIRERHLRAQCISRFKNHDEYGLKTLGQDVSRASNATIAFHEFLLAKLCMVLGRFQDAKMHAKACLKRDSRFKTELALDPSLQALLETDT